MRPLDPRRSIVARVTIAFGAIAVGVFATVGVLLHWTLERELMRAEFDEVQRKVELVRDLLQARGAVGIDAALRLDLERMLAGHGNLLLWLHDRDGRLLFGTGPEPTHGAAEGQPSLFTLADGRTTSGCRLGVEGADAANGIEVTVALADSMRGQVLGMYGRTVALVCLMGIVASVVLAAWAARRGFRPVRRLAALASRIGPASLSLRLPEEDGDTELQTLTAAFNAALDRVQLAYTRLEAFNADVAHELRTPLAALIGGTEVTLAADRSKDELLQLQYTQLELLQRLRSIVNDMLFLARADIGEQAGNLRPVSVADEARQVVEYFEGLIHERGARVRVEGDAHARCDSGLIRRAVSNLLSNALQHGGSRPDILIRVDETAGQARLTVRNPGPTIPADALPRLFDRFYRGERSRETSGDRFGLGLAIVRAIAVMHGGGVEARSSGGSTVVGFWVRK